MSTSVGSNSRTVPRSPRGRHVAVEGVEVPQRGIRRVIHARLLAFGEQVGNQPVAHVLGEGAQDIPGFDVAAGGQRQAFQRDHRVAAPVGEPMVAGDHRADFVARRIRPRRVGNARGGRDDELVGRQHQLGRRTLAGSGHRLVDQPPAALGLGHQGFWRIDGHHRVPRLGRRGQRHLLPRRQVDAKIARRPEHVAMRIAAPPAPADIRPRKVVRRRAPSLRTARRDPSESAADRDRKSRSDRPWRSPGRACSASRGELRADGSGTRAACAAESAPRRRADRSGGPCWPDRA